MENKVTIVNPKGQKVVADLLNVFRLEETNQDYAIYTFNQKDQSENIKYYKAKYQEKDVLLKEMKQDNFDANFNKIDSKFNEELIKDENILKQISTDERR